MKQGIPPAALVAAVVIAVLLLGFLGWKTFGSNSPTMDQTTIKAHEAAKQAQGQGLK